MIKCNNDVVDETIYGGTLGLSVAVALDYRPATFVGEVAYLGSFIVIGSVAGAALALEKKICTLAKGAFLGAACGLTAGNIICAAPMANASSFAKNSLELFYLACGALCGGILSSFTVDWDGEGESPV